MTSIATVDLAAQLWPMAEDDAAAIPLVTAATQASDASTDRDDQIPDLATTSASVNQLQSLASTTSSSALPAPSLPSAQQQTQAQQTAAQPQFNEDFYADGDDAE